jgi:hypothetical protein
MRLGLIAELKNHSSTDYISRNVISHKDETHEIRKSNLQIFNIFTFSCFSVRFRVTYFYTHIFCIPIKFPYYFLQFLFACWFGPIFGYCNKAVCSFKTSIKY